MGLSGVGWGDVEKTRAERKPAPSVSLTAGFGLWGSNASAGILFPSGLGFDVWYETDHCVSCEIVGEKNYEKTWSLRSRYENPSTGGYIALGLATRTVDAQGVSIQFDSEGTTYSQRIDYHLEDLGLDGAIGIRKRMNAFIYGVDVIGYYVPNFIRKIDWQASFKSDYVSHSDPQPSDKDIIRGVKKHELLDMHLFRCYIGLQL